MYELYYWPSIQGRGEFVRLALESAGAPYVDIARERGRGRGIEALMRLMGPAAGARPPFAPPFLRSGSLLIGQTASILQYLGPRHGLAPRAAAARLWLHQLQLTVADLLTEVHDTHHPIANGLYYEDQCREARRRAADFREQRLPKFLGYFERLLPAGRAGPAAGVLGRRLSYVDLSLFQVMAGLEYAFPHSMRAGRRRWPRLRALAARVADQPRVADYLRSPRRLPFSNEGIFRHYPELDAPGRR